MENQRTEEHPRVGDVYMWSEKGYVRGEGQILALVTGVTEQRVYILWKDLRWDRWEETWWLRSWFLGDSDHDGVGYARVREEG